MNFIINDREDNFDILKINVCNNIKCKTLLRVSSIRYLGLIFEKNLIWNLHVSNLVMRLRIMSYNFYKLQTVIPLQVNSISSIISSIIAIWSTYLGRLFC